MFCSNCGKEIDDKAVVCIGCGCAVQPVKKVCNCTDKSFIATLLLCCVGLAGIAGLHRLYTGKVLSGVFMFLTLGGLYIWTIIDLISILSGGYRTADGETLVK